jgi:hypothetical protein
MLSSFRYLVAPVVVKVFVTYDEEVVVMGEFPFWVYVLLLWDSDTLRLAVPDPDFFQ